MWLVSDATGTIVPHSEEAFEFVAESIVRPHGYFRSKNTQDLSLYYRIFGVQRSCVLSQDEIRDALFVIETQQVYERREFLAIIERANGESFRDPITGQSFKQVTTFRVCGLCRPPYSEAPTDRRIYKSQASCVDMDKMSSSMAIQACFEECCRAPVVYERLSQFSNKLPTIVSINKDECKDFLRYGILRNLSFKGLYLHDVSTVGKHARFVNCHFAHTCFENIQFVLDFESCVFEHVVFRQCRFELGEFQTEYPVGGIFTNCVFRDKVRFCDCSLHHHKIAIWEAFRVEEELISQASVANCEIVLSAVHFATNVADELEKAHHNRQHETIKRLVSLTNTKDVFEDSVLNAIRSADLVLLTTLVERPLVDYIDKYALQPEDTFKWLKEACDANSIAIVKILLDWGVCSCLTTPEHDILDQLTIWRTRAEVIDVLLSHPHWISNQAPNVKERALSKAIQLARIQTIKVLLKHGTCRTYNDHEAFRIAKNPYIIALLNN